MFRGFEWDENRGDLISDEYRQHGIAMNVPAFEPARHVTRAEYVKMLVRALSYQYRAEWTFTPFTDVDENMWYAEYIHFAVKNGWIDGYSDNTFRPNAPITRAEAAKILVHAINIPTRNIWDTEVKLSSPFSDVPYDSPFTPSIAALKENKVISWRTLTTYAPDEYILRSEVSRIIYRTFL